MNKTCHYCGYENEQDGKCSLCRHTINPDLTGKHTPAKVDKSPRLVDSLVKLGQTCVRVMRKEINERTQQVKIVQAHEGIVVQDNGSFVRVFNPAPLDKGGDASQESSELFPWTSNRVWCEITSERSRAYPISPALSF
jgi:hypothetical protein